jgi:bacillaene synthase trans-acting acyltransferase
MKRKIVFMFSGQGSQYYQMGKELYEKHPRFKLWMDHCDKILFSFIDASLVDILYQRNRKTEPFDNIVHTNPALVCIEYSLARVLMEMGIKPDYLLGYSLGEVSAAVISGAVTLEDAIELVVDYAKLLELESPAAGMLAIIESVDIMIHYPDLFKNVWLTGTNFDKNFVVGGLQSDILQLQVALNNRNIISQQLPVNYGFHTELMIPLEDKFKELARRIDFYPLKIPIISALSASHIKEIDADYFWQVIRYPVDFHKTIEWMLKDANYLFIDLGPSGTLATFVKYLVSSSSVSVGSKSSSSSLSFEVINQFGRDLKSLEKVKDSLLLENQ